MRGFFVACLLFYTVGGAVLMVVFVNQMRQMTVKTPAIIAQVASMMIEAVGSMTLTKRFMMGSIPSTVTTTPAQTILLVYHFALVIFSPYL